MKINNRTQPARVQIFYTPAETTVSLVTRTVSGVDHQNINLAALLSLREIWSLLWIKIKGKNRGEVFTAGKVIETKPGARK